MFSFFSNVYFYHSNQSVIVITHPTISLVKYFGVRDELLRLPTRSSFALSLKDLFTTTTVSFNHEQNMDNILIENYDDPTGLDMIRIFIKQFRKLYQIPKYFNVVSKNNFPTASGLASSGSGFAALSIALAELCQLNLSKQAVSALARLGSGSASRSIYAGIVVWHKGEDPRGTDCFAETIFPPDYWPELKMIIVVVSEQSKVLSTRNAGKMIIKSLNYQNWVDAAEKRIIILTEAIRDKKIDIVGSIMEQDCLEMHNCLKQVGITYHTKESHQVMDTIKSMREEKINCYFTSDAGPQIKVLCLEQDVELIITRITENIPKVRCLVSNIAADPVIKKSFITNTHEDKSRFEAKL